MSNVIKIGRKTPKLDLVARQRRDQVDQLMMESIENIQHEIARLEQVESLIAGRVPRMAIRKAKAMLIDAALLGCQAVSEEFDK